METSFYTYLHCRPDGTPFYVGKGSGNRAYELCDSRRNKHHLSTINKHGKENIKIFIFPCDSEDQAFADEVHQIAQLRKEGLNLCNKTNGGEGASGLIVSDETKRILAEKSRGQTHNRGRKHSKDFCDKISKRQLGKKVSEETRLKMSESHKGNKYCLGTKQTIATKKKRAESISETISNPEIKQKYLNNLAAIRKNPQIQEKRRLSMLLTWADPEKKAARLASRKCKSNGS